MLKNKSKVAIVGMGYWAPVLLRNLLKLNINVDAISETNFSRIKYIKKNYKNIKIFKSYKQMIAITEANAIIIATPARTHFKIAMDCLKKNKHILVEKPLCLKNSELNKIKILSKKNKLVVQTNYIYSFNPYVIYLKKLFDNKKLGNIKHIFMERLNLGKVKNDIDVFWNLAVHDLSILFYLFEKSKFKKINKIGVSLKKKNIFDLGILHIKINNKINAMIRSSWYHPIKKREITVIGEKGIVIFDEMNENKIKIYLANRKKIELNTSGYEYDYFKKNNLIRKINFISPKIKFKSPVIQALEKFLLKIRDKKKQSNFSYSEKIIKILDN